MEDTLTSEPQRVPGRSGGRKRDASRDAAILSATTDVLAEVGYERLTVDMVAARAQAGKGAVYRRWPSKTGMVLDAVAQMKRAMVDLEHLPDTGTFRGDMLALFRPSPAAESERFMKVMGGLAAMLAQQPEIAESGHDALIEPWVEANRRLIGRAVARGEALCADVESVAQMIPAMAGYRSLIQRRPFDRAFLVSLLDHLLLPALRIDVAPTNSLTGD